MTPIQNDDSTLIEFEDCGVSWGFMAKKHGRQVGYLWGQINGTRLKIEDFQVRDSLPIPWPMAHEFLVTIGVRCCTRNFRRQGIGSRLLDCLLTKAKQSQLTEIWGYVVSKDLQATPYLLNFYERRGFQIVSPDEECPESAVKKIVMSLRC